MLNEILPELKTSKPNDLKSTQVPTLKTLIRIDNELTPGFLNFQELFDMPGSDDFRKLGAIENSISPEDPTNIQVKIKKYITKFTSLLLELLASPRGLH